uniref:Agouti domain-containing protein n=2 Tax=Octopus bimaculoides TaxID=37653 RepID=A0A0L8G4S4_OCTBM
MKIILGVYFCALSYAMSLNKDAATVDNSLQVANTGLEERSEKCVKWNYLCGPPGKKTYPPCCSNYYCRCNSFWKTTCRCHGSSLGSLQGC